MNTPSTLSPDKPATQHFDGQTYDHSRDCIRLTGQLAAVKAVMLDAGEHRLSELAMLCGCSEASASARLRDLRKDRFGGWRIIRTHVKNGLFTYRMEAAPMPATD